MGLMTLQETIDLHEKLGDEGFFKFLHKSKGSSDIESFRYIFNLQVKLGRMMLPKYSIKKIGAWLETLSVDNVTQEHYDNLSWMMKVGGELFDDGVEIPEDMPEMEMRIHHGKRNKRRNKHKK